MCCQHKSHCTKLGTSASGLRILVKMNSQKTEKNCNAVLLKNTLTLIVRPSWIWSKKPKQSPEGVA